MLTPGGLPYNRDIMDSSGHCALGIKPAFNDACCRFKENKLKSNNSRIKEKVIIATHTNPIEKRNIRRGYIGLFFESVFVIAFFIIIIILLFEILKGEEPIRDIVIVIISSIILGVFLKDVIIKIGYLINRERDPLLEYLSKYGDYDAMCSKILNEIENNSIKVHNLYMSPEWIVNKTFTRIWALKISDIVWCYHRIFSVNKIPTNYLEIYDTNAKNHTIKCGGERNAKRIIEILSSYAPEVFYGYSEDIKNIWDFNPHIIIDKVLTERTKNKRR